jgi:Ca-activated chloride channel family protein
MSRILVISCLSLLILFNASPRLYCQQVSDEILLNATVTNKRGNYINGLTQTNFAVFDEKVEQKITTFSGADGPASVGILLDRSASMELAGSKRSFMKEALARFFVGSNPANEYFLVGFNKQPQLLVDWTRDAKSILDKLDAMPPPVGVTAFYDACYLGLEKVSRGPHRRHVLILISDAQDNVSHFRFAEVKRFLQESDALIYGIIPPESNLQNALGGSGTVLGVEGASILDELTTISGGFLYRPHSTKELNEAFEQVAVELRHQYSIGFRPQTSLNKKKYHRIKVTLSANEMVPAEFKSLTIRTRQGYYVPDNQK